MRPRVDVHDIRVLDEGWEWACATSGEPAWRPGLVADADGRDVDAHEWWFRTAFDAAPPADGEELVLRFEGLATICEVRLNGEPILESESAFAEHEVPVGPLLRGDGNELEIRCRALAPLLAVRRRPRARWRTRVAADGGLRWFRTPILGRAPGFAPGPAVVGPWRPVVLERRRRLAVDELTLRTRMDGDVGVLLVAARLRALAGDLPAAAEVELGGCTVSLPLPAGRAELRVPGVARWWPHTQGEPALHAVHLRIGDTTVDAGRVGFRTLESPGDLETDGLDLRVNGAPVFARGALWTPVAPAEQRRTLEQARDAGLNMIRLPGTGAYESAAFHDLCDELGLLVWQDFMFANMDYPVADDGFRATVEAEARQVLTALGSRPSLAVLCGNSEVEQQVAMLGQDPALGRGELFGELLPRLVREAEVDAPYVPSAPCGGDLPFRTDSGVANYFGVGAYLRPVEDARRAGVRFASECLAFANVPDGEGLVPFDARWKAGVPRDVGAEWDFDDVRDHYLAVLHGVDPAALRSADPERYLALSRAVTGEVMAEVFGEWRRAGSPCGGGLVLWLRDLLPGAGWGLLDHAGGPKATLHHLRRALAPVAVWTTDEGLNGIDVHVANDRAQPLRARLRVALYRDGEQRVEEASTDLDVPAHGAWSTGVEALLGRFVDASYAYRFGPPQQDAIVATLERGDGEGILGQAFRFPAGRPLATEPADRVGLGATIEPSADGRALLRVRSARLAYGVRIHAPGFAPSDDAFSVEPGGERLIELCPLGAEPATPPAATLTALNLEGHVTAAPGDA